MTVWFQNCWWIFGVVALVCCTGSELERWCRSVNCLWQRGAIRSPRLGVALMNLRVAIRRSFWPILRLPCVLAIDRARYVPRELSLTYRMRREPVDSRWDYQWESTNEPPLSVDGITGFVLG